MPSAEGPSFFEQRLGPLPIWVWLAALAVAGLGYMFWKKIGPFAQGAGGYPTAGDPASLGSLLGAGGTTNLGVVEDGGPGDPGVILGRPKPHPLPAQRLPYGHLNVYGVNPAAWSAASEHQKELWKLNPGASAGVR